MSQIKVEFCILGDCFLPDEITKMLSISPTEAYRKDDIFLGGPDKDIPMTRKECLWRLETEYTESISVDTELRKVYDNLKDKVEILKEIQKRFATMFKIVIVINLVDNPIIGIEKDIVKFAAEIDAEFDFDTYI